MAISLLWYGFCLVIYIRPLYRLRCHICGSVTRRHVAPCRLPNLSPPFKLASSLGHSTAKFCFCYLIAALSASCIMLFLVLPWSRLPLPCQSFLSKVLHSFHIYIGKSTPSTHRLHRTCSHASQRHIHYAVSSPTLHFSPDRVAISYVIHSSSS